MSLFKVLFPDQQKLMLASLAGHQPSTVKTEKVETLQNQPPSTVVPPSPLGTYAGEHSGLGLSGISGGPATPIIPAYVPKMTCYFSGEGLKGNSSHELWKQESLSLMMSGQFTGLQIMTAIRRSIRGLPGEVLEPLGNLVTLTQCINKFDIIFGNVIPVKTTLEQFWSSQQNFGESVSS